MKLMVGKIGCSHGNEAAESGAKPRRLQTLTHYDFLFGREESGYRKGACLTKGCSLGRAASSIF